MKKKNNSSQTQKQFNPHENLPKYIKEIGRKLDIFETRIDEEAIQNGLGYVIVSRKRKSGEIIYCNFLVDTYCLGIKDVYFELLNEIDYSERISDIEAEFNVTLKLVDPNYAFNVIYGALEYAEDLGFKPHKDFNIAEFLLPSVENIDYIDIEFGKNGKPMFFQGPSDNANIILAQLEKSVGVGNFEAFLAEGFNFYNEDEFDEEDEFDDIDFDDELDEDEGYDDFEEVIDEQKDV